MVQSYILMNNEQEISEERKPLRDTVDVTLGVETALRHRYKSKS